MKHIWSIICQNSSIDRDSNSLCLLNTVEEITIKNASRSDMVGKKQVLPISFEIVSLWQISDANKGALNIVGEFVDPSGKLLDTYERKIDIPVGFGRFRNRIKINGFSITGPGIYWIKIKRNDKKKSELVAELPIEVKIIKNEKSEF